MKDDDLQELWDNLIASSAKEPSPEAVRVLTESVLENALTDEEILTGYARCRDEENWFPTPKTFLEKARKPVAAVEISTEAVTIFDLIVDNPRQAYGRYEPEVGTVRERRLIEAAHGRAAGIAFVAAGGAQAFSEMTEKGRPFVRNRFVDAYKEARVDYGAPLSLTPPTHRLEAAKQETKQIAGDAPTKRGAKSQQEIFSEMIRGDEKVMQKQMTAKEWERRKKELLKQAAQIEST